MDKSNYLCIQKTIYYEWDYLRRKFRLTQAFISILFLVILIIISLGDTQSFFIGENSPIPNNWQILKDKKIVNIASILIISMSYFLPWLSNFLTSKKEASELAFAIGESLIPAIEIELKALRTKIKKKFRLSEEIRISVFIPVRKGFCRWSFQMVCREGNIPDRELMAQFKLNEGVIGYTFIKNEKHCMEYINVSDPNNLPISYKKLTAQNKPLIRRDIKAVLIAAAFQEGSIAGLLAIDTPNSQDTQKMEDKSLHDEALNWIIARSKAIRLLWRMKNSV
jgi:hypothetical protein